jgi:hypothetical protein
MATITDRDRLQLNIDVIVVEHLGVCFAAKFALYPMRDYPGSNALGSELSLSSSANLTSCPKVISLLDKWEKGGR